MYEVKTRIFGKYVGVGFSESYAGARELAEAQKKEGWLFVIIVHPNDIIEEYN